MFANNGAHGKGAIACAEIKTEQSLFFLLGTMPLLLRHSEDPKVLEVGIDEVGRGPLFGRVYTAAVILPKEGFDVTRVKDSKLFTSDKKIREAAAYIQAHALSWAVHYEDERVIDQVNILKATMYAMREAARRAILQCQSAHPDSSFLLLVDGDRFEEPLCIVGAQCQLEYVPHLTVEKGDTLYASIASASILAKVARDDYIYAMCAEHPTLDAQYGLARNKGYGTRQHMAGLAEHGPSPWHRLSFRPCLEAKRSREERKRQGQGQGQGSLK